MDTDALIARRTKAETTFDELKNQREQFEAQIKDLETKINQLDSEILRVQGEYRVINELLEPAKTPEVNKIDASEADKSVKPATKKE